MRRIKPILLGSVLIVLLCVLFFLRTQDDPGYSVTKEDTKRSSLPPPSVEQLQSQISKETGSLQTMPAMVPPDVRFKEEEKPGNTLPSNRWFDGSRSPVTPEEWEMEFYQQKTPSKKKTSKKPTGS